MRSGNLGVSLVPIDGGALVEQENGQVLARPGQVYGVRIHNYRNTRAVAKVRIDGNNVTEGGIIVPAFGHMTLERPVTAGENGRFTVFAEGNEAVFGADGGRNDPDLGLIEVRAQWERQYFYNTTPVVYTTHWSSTSTVTKGVLRGGSITPTSVCFSTVPNGNTEHVSEQSVTANYASVMPDSAQPKVERAAGTGLTGRSSQEFSNAYVGELEAQETVITMRLVIGTEAAVNGPRPLPGRPGTPPRPAPLP